jgi:hypothetical protein
VNKNQTILLVAGLVTVIAVAVIVVALNAHYMIKTTGRIQSIGVQVYGDESLTTLIDAIDWGTITPGSYGEVTLWVRNNGTTPGTLTFATTDFQPPTMQPYITLSWDYNNQTLQPDVAIPVDLRCNLASNPPAGVKTFSFNLIISNSG